MGTTRFALSALPTFLVACSASAQAPKAPQPVTVSVAHVRRQTVATYDTLDGQVTPYLQASLSTQQSGTIVRVFANEGDRVRAGEALAKIDDSPLQATLIQQEGNSVSARAKLDQSTIQVPITNQQYVSALDQSQQTLAQARQQQQTDRAALSNAQLVYRSDEQLYRQGFVAQTADVQARASLVAAQQTLQIDTEKVTQALAALAAAHRNLLNTPLQRQVVNENRGALTTAAGQVQLTQTQIGQTTLVAPFDGVVTQRLLDPGAYAGPNQPMFSIAQIDPIYVDFNVKDDDLAFVRPGGVVSFTTSGDSGRRYDARVVDVNAVPTTGTLLYRARLVVRNPGETLRGGMLVSVRVTRARHANVLVVPRSAVLQSGGEAAVFLVAPAPSPSPGAAPQPMPSGSPGPHAVAKKTAVTLGLQSDAFVEISGANIRDGTTVVGERPDNVVDETPIAPRR